MIDLPLTREERETYEEALARSHRIRILLRLFDRHEAPIGAVGGELIGGAVQVAGRDAAVRRSASLELADPKRRIQFEPDSPGDAAIFASNFIGIEYGVYVEGLARWVDVPIFHGPVTGFERKGGIARVECQGKERLLLAPHYAGKSYMIRKRSTVGDAIRKVAGNAGESRFALPELDQKLPRGRAVSGKSEPWKVIRGGEENAKGKPLPGLLARAGSDLEPYYDGRGRLTVRRRQSSPVFTFRTGEGGHVVGDQPTLSYDLEAFRNVVIVEGGRRKKRKAARARVALPPNHPLSPQSLGRNGVPREIIEWYDRDGLKTDQACARFGRKELDRLSREGVTASFSSLVIPHLEEDDQVSLRTPEGAIAFPLEQMTIPLVGSESMAVNGMKVVRR